MTNYFIKALLVEKFVKVERKMKREVSNGLTQTPKLF